MKHSAILPALLLLAPAAWADSMRCGQRLVVDGTTREQVVAWCGEPTSTLQRVVLRPPVVWYYGRPVNLGGGYVEVLVETWTYNLGPQKLMRRIVFEDGAVVDIETLGYGYREKS